MPYGRMALGLTRGRWDLELGAGYLGHSQERTENNGIGYNITASELDLRVRYWLPVTDHFKLYAEGGPALVDWHAEQWKFSGLVDGVGIPEGWAAISRISISPQAGLGAGYDVSEHWRLTAGATRTWNYDGYSTTQVGLGVRFNF